MAQDVSELAFDLSLRTLGQQEAALNELRARTGTILTASAIAASFLGAAAVASPGHGWLTALGFASFAVSVAAAAFVLWPKNNLVFALRGSGVLSEEESADLSEARRWLSSWIEDYVDENQPKLDWLYSAYRVATVGVLVQAGIWLLKLGVS